MVTSTRLPLQRQTQRGRAAALLSPGCVAHEGPSLAIHFLRGRMSAPRSVPLPLRQLLCQAQQASSLQPVQVALEVVLSITLFQ